MWEEIGHHKLTVCREALEAVKEVRTHGDLNENLEHRVAKRGKNRDESRIHYLEKMIKITRAISNSSREDGVGLGDTVEVYIPDDDEIECYKLVITVRGNSSQGLISIDSPLGEAIRGRKMGDKIYVKVGNHFGYGVEIHSTDKTTEDDEDKLYSY